jgi:predicted DNA-binding transcriptional regulator YafY
MKELRLRYVEYLLQKHSHNGVVVRKVVDKYEVHRVTVYRDINKVLQKTDKTGKG